MQSAETAAFTRLLSRSPTPTCTHSHITPRHVHTAQTRTHFKALGHSSNMTDGFWRSSALHSCSSTEAKCCMTVWATPNHGGLKSLKLA